MIKFVRGIHQWNVSNACHSCRHEENQDSEALSREKPTRERVVRVEKEEGAEESLHEAAAEMDLVSESFTTALRILILISDEKRTTSRIFGLKNNLKDLGATFSLFWMKAPAEDFVDSFQNCHCSRRNHVGVV